MPAKFSDKIYNYAKFLYINEEKNIGEIRAEFPRESRPSTKTIQRWALDKDKFGKTWNDYKLDSRDLKFKIMSPESHVAWIYEQIDKIRNDPTIDPIKAADALSKYQKYIDKLIDPKMRVNSTFSTLEDYVGFVQLNHPDLIEVPEFIQSIRSFKNERLNQIVSRQ